MSVQVHVSSSPDPVAGMLACSDNMFVHNNSKHGRKSRKVESAYGGSLLFLIIKAWHTIAVHTAQYY